MVLVLIILRLCCFFFVNCAYLVNIALGNHIAVLKQNRFVTNCFNLLNVMRNEKNGDALIEH